MRRVAYLLAIVITLGAGHPGRADVPEKYRPAVRKALAWLVKQQNKDGSWSSPTQPADVGGTAMAGLALLMEGSTATRGQYAEPIRKAIAWMSNNCQTNGDDGLIARNRPAEYMFGQAYAVLFLASARAREDKIDGTGLEARLAKARQRELDDVLKRAVQFIARAQSTTGGWFYVSSKEAQDQEAASSSIAQVLALRAARLAGIELPKETLPKAFAYLEKMTTKRGGIPLSLRGRSGERPSFTIAAFAATFGDERLKLDLAKKWLGYSEHTILVGRETFALFHHALAMHALGEHGQAKLMGKKSEQPTWSKQRPLIFDHIVATQSAAGNWTPRDWKPREVVFGTAINLIMLQLDNEHVPILRARKE